MNARQKAKKYKRMYEELLKKPIKFNIEQHKIDTLKFEKFYPEALIVSESSDYLRNVIIKDIAQDLANNIIDKYVFYKMEFLPHLNKWRFSGEIKVVDMQIVTDTDDYKIKSEE